MEHRLKLHRYCSTYLPIRENGSFDSASRSFLVSTLWSPRRTWYKFYVGAISNDEIAHRTKPNVTVEKSVGCALSSDAASTVRKK